MTSYFMNSKNLLDEDDIIKDNIKQFNVYYSYKTQLKLSSLNKQ